MARTNPAPRPDSGEPGKSIGLVSVLIVLLAVVAVAARATPTGTSAPPAGQTIPGLWLDAALFAATIAVVVSFLLVLFVLRPNRRRKRQPDDPPEHVEERPPLRWQDLVLLLGAPLLLGVATFLVLLKVATHSGGTATMTLPSSPPAPSTISAATPLPALPPTSPVRLGELHWWIPVVALIVLAVVFVGAAVLRRLQRWPLANAARRQTLQEALEESIEAVLKESDPRRAVISAYAHMEYTLKRRGAPRRPYEAPFEYLTRALPLTPSSEPDLRRLTELYEQARFSHHRIDQRMKEDAIQALQAIRGDLEQQAMEAGRA